MPNTAQSTVVTGPWTSRPHPPASRSPERRRVAPASGPARPCDGLAPAQLVTLEALRIFGWRLGFVRRPMFLAPIPVVFDPAGTRHVVILEDGTLDEHPTLKLRN